MRGGEPMMTYGEIAQKMNENSSGVDKTFRGEFEFQFDQTWDKYLAGKGLTEQSTVDVNELKKDPILTKFGPFNRAFPPQ